MSDFIRQLQSTSVRDRHDADADVEPPRDVHAPIGKRTAEEAERAARPVAPGKVTRAADGDPAATVAALTAATDRDRDDASPDGALASAFAFLDDLRGTRRGS